MTLARFIAALAMAAIVATSAVADGYRLQSGDTVEVGVAGLPDYGVTAAIDIDGNVSLPLAGTVPAAGRTVEELRSALQDILPSKALTRRIYDGTEVQTAIAPDEIFVRVTQYRSIYVGGDVDRPGAQPFLPGKTARQAVVDAGGLDLLRSRVVDPILTHADLEAERQALGLELKRLELAQARVEAELAGDGLSEGDGAGTLAALSRRELDARLESRARDRESAAQSQGHLQDRIRFLGQQLESEQAVAAADAANEARIRTLAERGVSSESALVQAQRETLASLARAREVSADMAQTARDLEDVSRTATRADDVRTVELLQEAQQLTEQVAVVTARLGAVTDKLLYVGGIGADSLSLASGDFVARLFRGSDAPVELDLDSPLQPGDVIEIEITPEALGRVLGTDQGPAPAPPRSAGKASGRVRRRTTHRV